jgi:hypothetical protein
MFYPVGSKKRKRGKRDGSIYNVLILMIIYFIILCDLIDSTLKKSV